MTVGSKGQDIDDLRALTEGVCTTLGVEVVDIDLRRTGARWHLRIDIDRAVPEGVGLEDCRRVSLALDAALEEQNPIDHSYNLEVSSPGIDRPISTPDDIRRNTGRKVTVETSNDREGRSCYTGILLGLENGRLRIHEENAEEDIEIELAEIARTRQYMPF